MSAESQFNDNMLAEQRDAEIATTIKPYHEVLAEVERLKDENAALRDSRPTVDEVLEVVRKVQQERNIPGFLSDEIEAAILAHWPKGA